MSEPIPEVSGSPWATVAQAREVWNTDDAPLDDELVGRLLRITYPRCLAYARAIPDVLVDAELVPGPVPEAYTHANILAARDAWRHRGASSADPYTVEPAELEPEVRVLLRPPSGVPVVL